MDSQERRRADLKSGLTDGRRDSNAIEHLAAAAAASCRKRRRRWPVAILINFSGPTGPHSLRKATKRALKWSRRIVFTWGWEGNQIPVAPGSSTVTIELEPADDGTLLRLTHSGLEPTDIQELHRKGWERYLDRLARRTTGEDPGPDRYND